MMRSTVSCLQRHTGVCVSWLNGFGFVKDDADGSQVFIHRYVRAERQQVPDNTTSGPIEFNPVFILLDTFMFLPFLEHHIIESYEGVAL